MNAEWQIVCVAIVVLAIYAAVVVWSHRKQQRYLDELRAMDPGIPATVTRTSVDVGTRYHDALQGRTIIGVMPSTCGNKVLLTLAEKEASP